MRAAPPRTLGLLAAALAVLGPAVVACSAPAPVASAAGPAAPATRAATTAPRGTAPVDVVVAFAVWEPGAAQVEVGAYVAGAVEDGGRCTLGLTAGDLAVSAEAAAVADVAVTGCGALVVPGSRLPAGTWTATVAYTSPTSTGRSAPVEIEVP